jgi:hypothetical protein
MRRTTSGLSPTALTAACALLLALVAGCARSAPAPAAAPSPSPTPTQLTAYLDAFSWQDNNPPNSNLIGDPSLNHSAGGQGTFTDPITVVASDAGTVPHALGTIFYLPTILRYVIVRETGAPPGPPGTALHLIVWIDGRTGTAAQSSACESAITGTVAVVINPAQNLPVLGGPILANGTCRYQN